MPPLQPCEQHSLLLVHGLPAVLQATFSAWQVPFWQWPEQHELALVHAWVSAMQAAAWAHLPFEQDRLQHSIEVVQAYPAGRHCERDDRQVLLVGSQVPVQQSLPTEQATPEGRQVGSGNAGSVSVRDAPASDKEDRGASTAASETATVRASPGPAPVSPPEIPASARAPSAGR